MHIVLTGASGRSARQPRGLQRDTRVDHVTALVRTPIGIAGDKVRELVCPDLFDIAGVANQLRAPDACLFCAGVSSVGMSRPTTAAPLTISLSR